MPKRILILSARVGSGHTMAALALEYAFRQIPDLEVCHLDASSYTNRIHQLTYTGVYYPVARIAPWLMDWAYYSTHTPFGSEWWLPLWDRLHTGALRRAICDYNPTITICTHFMPAQVVGQLIAAERIQCSLSLAFLDYDLHGLGLVRRFSRYFVALEEARAYAISLGLPAERVVATGIPVDPRFGEPFDRAQLLACYQLDPQRPIVLVSAGSTGSTQIWYIVEQLMAFQANLQFLVICGNNQQLKYAIEALVMPQANRFRVIGYTHQMYDLMRLATLFIGKPGGLTAAECMAAALPMLIVDPLPGQEYRNSDHLLEEGAALRCIELSTIAYKVERIFSEPGLLARMQQSASKFGRPYATEQIIKLLLDHDLPVMDVDRPLRRQMIDRATRKITTPIPHYRQDHDQGGSYV